jgi:hypothetical protein
VAEGGDFFAAKTAGATAGSAAETDILGLQGGSAATQEVCQLCSVH